MIAYLEPTNLKNGLSPAIKPLLTGLSPNTSPVRHDRVYSLDQLLPDPTASDHDRLVVDQLVSGLVNQLSHETDWSAIGFEGVLNSEPFPDKFAAIAQIKSSTFNVSSCNLDSSVGELRYEEGSASLVKLTRGTSQAKLFTGNLVVPRIRLTCSVQFKYYNRTMPQIASWPLSMVSNDDAKLAFDITTGRSATVDEKQAIFQLKNIQWSQPPQYMYTMPYPLKMGMVGQYVQDHLEPNTTVKANKLIGSFLNINLGRRYQMSPKNQHLFENLVKSTAVQKKTALNVDLVSFEVAILFAWTLSN